MQTLRRARATHPKGAAAPRMPRVLLDATTTPDIVTVPKRTVLALDGHGAPEGPTFQASVGAIYGVAYTLKFAHKKTGRSDFKIGPLEARWWTDEPSRLLPTTPRESWRWQLRIAVPQSIRVADLAGAVDESTHKHRGKLEGSAEAGRVALVQLPAARYGRVLHVGPYSTEGESFARILEAVAQAGFVPGNAHVEVYLSDPRRTQPEKLKTVLLLESATSSPE